MIIALVSETRMVSVSDLERLRGALEIQARQVCDAWILSEPVAVEVFASGKRLPEGVSPIVCVSDGGDEGTLGAHHFAGDRPAARVFVERTSGLNAGSYAVSEVASHEMCEMLVNPELGAWLQHVGRAPGIESPVEICDCTQNSYEEPYKGTTWRLSNWLLPSFWQTRYSNDVAVQSLIHETGRGVDWACSLSRAGEIGSEGYSVFRERVGGKTLRRWSEDSMGPMEAGNAKLARKKHHASRTSRLGGIPR